MQNKSILSKKWTSSAAERLLSISSTKNVDSAIEWVARKLLENVTTPPTNVEEIFPKLNIIACAGRQDLPASGQLHKAYNGFSIAYNSDQPDARIRFTIAHEMGHAFFEKNCHNPPRAGEELERICDLIAAEILMPRWIFYKMLPDRLDILSIFFLANTFETSLTMTAHRCADFLEISLFEVFNGQIAWGRGVVSRNHGYEPDDVFLKSLEAANNGSSGVASVLINRRRWEMEWKCIGNGRALFLLRDPNSIKVKPKYNQYAYYESKEEDLMILSQIK